jgi:hypothetical protein
MLRLWGMVARPPVCPELPSCMSGSDDANYFWVTAVSREWLYVHTTSEKTLSICQFVSRRYDRPRMARVPKATPLDEI